MKINTKKASKGKTFEQNRFYQLKERALKGEKIALLTCYDASFASLFKENNVDAVLVGDSLGQVIQGADNTLSVSAADIIYHVRAVKRGCDDMPIMADLPFISLKSPETALQDALKICKAGADIIKIEGEEEILPIIESCKKNSIKTCAHLGLMPQKSGGSLKVRGRDDLSRKKIIESAILLEKAGADWILLEWSSRSLAQDLVKQTSIPIIGIGSGPDCHAQILVIYDLLGISKKSPPFSKNMLKLGCSSVQKAVKNWTEEVKNKTFPSKEHWRE